jgi:hypothetical protein
MGLSCVGLSGYYVVICFERACILTGWDHNIKMAQLPQGRHCGGPAVSRPDSTCHLTNELSKGLCVELVVGFPPTRCSIQSPTLSWRWRLKVCCGVPTSSGCLVCTGSAIQSQWATKAFKGGYEGCAVWRFSWDSAVYYMVDCAPQALRIMRDRCSRTISQVWLAVYYTADPKA